jgi:asparagine synthase (glutamine-hydrolysing)
VCGIVGTFRFDEQKIDLKAVEKAISCLQKRGPDHRHVFAEKKIALGHSRLAIIDLEATSNQPFQDPTGRYVLAYNGEIFNFKELKKELQSSGISFQTQSDTEVLLHLLILEGVNCLQKLNGFFSFAFYDRHEENLLISRDRYGVKPMYVYQNDSQVSFASEMKALVALGIPKQLDINSLLCYLQLYYIPSPDSIFSEVKKLLPSHWMSFDKHGKQEIGKYYELNTQKIDATYAQKKSDLEELLSQSVQKRLVSDVPVGVFLSGGVDSSIVAYLAKKHSPHIQSFSIGFKDASFYDESIWAEKVAKHLHLQHHTFFLSNEEMLGTVQEAMSYIDEPFADSSAIAVYNLCKHTKQYATVALTGDGADEVFGGYNKHLAEYRIRQKNPLNTIMKFSSPILDFLPESRSHFWGNELRKLKKYSNSIGLSEKERYWKWCCFSSESETFNLLSEEIKSTIQLENYLSRKESKWQQIFAKNDLDNVLASDLHMVLEGDMLVKTDRMSMANSMELRNPFLDPLVVDFAFGLNENDKIDAKRAKKILKDTFKDKLPQEVFTRPKHGFEVPMQKWLENELGYMVTAHLSPDFLKEQGIFSPAEVVLMLKKLKSNNPGNVAQRIWSLVVFQDWWKRYML